MTAVSGTECVIVTRENTAGKSTYRCIRYSTDSMQVVPLLTVGPDSSFDIRSSLWRDRENGLLFFQRATRLEKDTFSCFWTSDGGRVWDSLSFISSHRGVLPKASIVGPGRFVFSIAKGIVRVDAASKTWVEDSVSEGRLTHCHFFDSLHAVAFVNSNAVIRSNNGGRTWDSLFAVDSLAQKSITVTPGAAYILVGNVLRRSLDAGQSWQLMTVAPWGMQNLLAAVGAENIWMDADISPAYYGERILIARRSGNRWGTLATPNAVDTRSMALAMWSEDSGWSVTGGVMYFTSSGGRPAPSVTLDDYTSKNQPRIRVTWKSAAFSWLATIVQRRSSGSPIWESIDTIPNPYTICWDEGLAAGVPYEYRLSALLSEGGSTDLTSDTLSVDAPKFLDLAEYMIQNKYIIPRYQTWDVMRSYDSFDSAVVSLRRLHDEETADAIAHVFHIERVSKTGIEIDTQRIIESKLQDRPIFCNPSDFQFPILPGYYMPYVSLGFADTTILNAKRTLRRFSPVPQRIAENPPDTLLVFASAGNPAEWQPWRFKRGFGLVVANLNIIVILPVWQWGARLIDYTTPLQDAHRVLPIRIDAAYPNPSSSLSTIDFTLARRATVTLDVYSLLGTRVARILEAEYDAGSHNAVFTPGSLPPGVYLLRLSDGESANTRKLVVVK